MRCHALFVSVLVACGGGGDTPIDAAIIDAPPDAPPDASPDALIDAPPPTLGAYRYVVDHERIPSNNIQARMYGLDLDADGVVDNQLGMVLATLSSMGFSVQTDTTKAVDAGSMIMLGELHADDPTTTFTVFEGTNPMPAPCGGAGDTVCRHHLAGTATFDVTVGSAHDTPLTGAIASGVFLGGPGSLHLDLVMTGVPINVALIGARVRLTDLTATSFGESVLGGAISQTEVDTKLFPAVQVGFTAIVAHDCTALANPPTCGCASGSTGKTALDLFDAAPKDCAISLDEVKTNSLIRSLFAPDVTIGGQPALSIGVGVTAVQAAFTP